MKKISFKDFECIMSYDVAKKQDPCIEIEFCVDGCVEYQSSWLSLIHIFPNFVRGSGTTLLIKCNKENRLFTRRLFITIWIGDSTLNSINYLFQLKI